MKFDLLPWMGERSALLCADASTLFNMPPGGCSPTATDRYRPGNSIRAAGIFHLSRSRSLKKSLPMTSPLCRSFPFPSKHLLYQQGTGATGDRHVWLDSAGKQIAQLSDPAVYGATRISPDGERIATTMVNAMGNKGGASPLWLWDLKGGTRAPLSADTIM